MTRTTLISQAAEPKARTFHCVCICRSVDIITGRALHLVASLSIVQKLASVS
jgi:hypothetical protein